MSSMPWNAQERATRATADKLNWHRNRGHSYWLERLQTTASCLFGYCKLLETHGSAVIMPSTDIIHSWHQSMWRVQVRCGAKQMQRFFDQPEKMQCSELSSLKLLIHSPCKNWIARIIMQIKMQELRCKLTIPMKLRRPSKLFSCSSKGHFRRGDFWLKKCGERLEDVFGWSSFDNVSARQSVAEQIFEASRSG